MPVFSLRILPAQANRPTAGLLLAAGGGGLVKKSSGHATLTHSNGVSLIDNEFYYLTYEQKTTI
jgi:hypothetical protein